jgi:hypothetical protein
MRKLVLFILLCITSIPLYSQSTVPFTVEIQEFQRQNAPALQSFAVGRHNNYLLLIGGRTNGMHSFPLPPLGGFPAIYANSNFFVYDPITDSVWQRSIYADLSLSVASQFRSTNMQSIQNGNTLYLTGGYGKDSSGALVLLDSFVTFPKLSAINVSGMINAIKTNSSVAPFVRQMTDTMFAVTGGELRRIDNSYYLVVGQKFTGKYAFPQTFVQQYTNCIKKFDIEDNGTTINITNKSYMYDTANLHRRDLNVVPQITNPSGAHGITIYGGVFDANNNPYLNPVYITPSSATVDLSFQQRYSQYSCPVLPVYDSVRNNMSNVFFGGISLYNYDTLLHQSVIDTTGCGGTPCIPFIPDLTVITKFSNGTSKDSVLPIRFPQNRMLGSEARLLMEENVPMYSNRVVKLQSLSGRTFVGYIYGGIEAFTANPLVQMIRTRGRNNGTASDASNSIFRVYITPNSVGINPLGNYLPEDYKLLQNYPNPFNPTTKIKFDIPLSGFVALKVYDVMGREIENLVNLELKAGSYEIEFNGMNKASGIYYYKIITDKFQETKKMILVK